MIGHMKMTKAVIFSTIKVSTKTPMMATKPCWAGYFTLATAWACEVGPCPPRWEEQAAGHAVAHGFLDARADDAARGGGRIERAHEDHLQSRDDMGGVG